MFLLVGMVERRCGTRELDSLGGMARGPPRARDRRARRRDDRAGGARLGDVRRRVPDHGRRLRRRAGGTRSSSRSGSCSPRCTSLRPISAILHVKPGPAVREERSTCGPVELALVLPLLLVLLVPLVLAGARQRELVPGDRRCAGDREGFRVIDTPTVDWLALSPTLALLGASGIALLAARPRPAWMRKAVTAARCARGLRHRGRARRRRLRRERRRREVLLADRWRATSSPPSRS